MLRIPPDTIPVSDFCNDSSIAKHSRYNRRFALRQLATANGKETAEEIIEDIKTEKVTLYVASRRMVDEMRKRMKPSTVFQYRSILPEMFRAVLGEDNFRKTVFDRLVPRGDYYIHSIKKVPTIDELKQMLDIATPLYTALVGGLACGGFRIEEWVSRKWGDLEVRPSGITRVKLHASETKARVTRYAFLTKEVRKWISDYRESIRDQLYGNSQWLFPGEKGKHLHNSTASQEVKALFERVGCKDLEDGTEVYSCHSFRTFADSQMAKCGLDRKFIALILSHKSKLAAEASYVDWTEIERQWVEKCEQNMTWFRPTEVIKEVVDPVARKLLADLLNIIGAQRTVGKGQKGSTKLLEERVQKFLESIEDKERSRIRSE